MKVIPPSFQEIAFKQIQRVLMINPLMMNDYYSQLVELSKMFLTAEDLFILEKMVKDIEEWISDDLNRMTLYEAEIRMFQNMDLLSGFEVNGILITQLEIQEKLGEVKQFITQKVYAYMPYIRFTSPIRVD